jgi:sulfur-oxidizing protein SoxY
MHTPSTSLRRRWLQALTLLPVFSSVRGMAEVLNIRAEELVARRLKSQGVVIDLPDFADSGASVPLTADITAPAGLTLDAIEVFTPGNPNTLAVKLRLHEAWERYRFSTRLRLAGSQNIWVVVTLSNGTQIGAYAPTTVTSSACFDAS